MESNANFPPNLDQFITEIQKYNNMYLDSEFNIDKFAGFLGLQTYLTSKVLREKYNISFSDLKHILKAATRQSASGPHLRWGIVSNTHRTLDNNIRHHLLRIVLFLFYKNRSCSFVIFHF